MYSCPDTGPWCSWHAQRIIQKNSDYYCEAMSCVTNKENVQVYLYSKYFPQCHFPSNVDWSLLTMS
jgi:hypothetical protein